MSSFERGDNELGRLGQETILLADNASHFNGYLSHQSYPLELYDQSLRYLEVQAMDRKPVVSKLPLPQLAPMRRRLFLTSELTF